ncbi:MAG: ABC transporter ATP-binding protein [Candidatus Bathyarchaeia archaeon]
MSLLLVENVTKRFGGLLALNNVTLTVGEGEILGLIGPNGSGKTTLINVISGVYTPEYGRVIFKGTDITKTKSYQRSRLGIARTYQIVRVFPNLTVFENVLIGALNGRNYGKIVMNKAEERTEDIISLVGLSHVKDFPAKILNVQDRKKVELARALATDPDLLMLDECLAGLTPSEIFEMLSIIRKIRDERGISIIMVEHIMHAVMNVSDRIVVLNEGKKIAEGTPKEISNDQKVAEVYFGDRELALKFVRRTQENA